MEGLSRGGGVGNIPWLLLFRIVTAAALCCVGTLEAQITAGHCNMQKQSWMHTHGSCQKQRRLNDQR